MERRVRAFLFLLSSYADAGLFSKEVAGSRFPCPDNFQIAGPSSMELGYQLQLEVNNHAERTLKLILVNSEGQEEVQVDLLPSSRNHLKAFTGQLWRARDDDGRLWLEHGLAPGPRRKKESVTIGGCGARVTAPKPDERAWLEEHGHTESLTLSRCPLNALLSEIPLYGFHVACVIPMNASTKKRLHRLCIFPDGMQRGVCASTFAFSGSDLEDLTEKVGSSLGIQRALNIFTADGRRITTAKNLFTRHRSALVFLEGPVWHWPPVRKGFVRDLNILNNSGHRVTLRTLSLQPRVFEVSGLISDAESKRIRKKAGKHMKASEDVLSAVGKDGARSSQTYFLPSGKDEVLIDLDRRVQNMSRVPISHAENLQVLRYDVGGQYSGHHDAFSPEFASQNEHVAESIQGGSSNRVLTVFMYLSDVEAGGETAFLRSGGLATPLLNDDCSVGLSVPPTHKRVVMFYHLHPNGVFDQMSMHAGCPVRAGTKWAANFWMWTTPQDAKRSSHHAKMASDLVAAVASDDSEEALLTNLSRSEKVHTHGNEDGSSKSVQSGAPHEDL